MVDTTQPPIARHSFIRGLRHGALNGFYGFLVGGFVSVVAPLVTSAPSWLSLMPLIGLVGGFAFGFGVGMEE